MDENENPYEILGLPPNATLSQIKSAYRKLALKHHPDKQTTEEKRQESTKIFTKISNAYEILSDDELRREFDANKQPGVAGGGGGGRARRGGGNEDDFFRRGFGHGFGSGVYDPFMSDPFFNPSASARRTGSRSGFHDHHHHFHDPFEIFERVFGEEFGSRPRRGGGRSFHHGSIFDEDPFFSSGFGMGGGFGGMMGSMMSNMSRQMGMMRRQHEQMMSSYDSRPSIGGTGGGGEAYSEAVSTTTRIVNGKRQTITERTLRRPDGTVERHVETTGDDDFPQQQWIEDDRGCGGYAGYLPDSSKAGKDEEADRRKKTKRSKSHSSSRKA